MPLCSTAQEEAGPKKQCEPPKVSVQQVQSIYNRNRACREEPAPSRMDNNNMDNVWKCKMKSLKMEGIKTSF